MKPYSLTIRALHVLLWVGVAVVLVLAVWHDAPSPVSYSFDLAGNRTNLYIVVYGEPKSGDGEGEFVYRQLDARGEWSGAHQAGGDPVQVAAWQEDLAVMFPTGGLRLLGSSELPYQQPPMPNWRTIAMATSEATLLALGLDSDSQPVFTERGRSDLGEAWGDVVPADLRVDWTPAAMASVRAAVRDKQFYVVWTEPLAESPIASQLPRQKVRYARRDAKGKWHGPDDAATNIVPDGPVCIASLGKRLVMVFREAVGAPKPGGDASTGESAAASGTAASAESAQKDEAATTKQLAWAEFSGDNKWHRVGAITVPAGEGEEKGEGLGHYGLAQFGDHFVVAIQGASGETRLFTFDPDKSSLTPEKAMPATTAKPASEGPPAGPSMGLMLALAAGTFVILLIIRSFQQRAIRQQIASGEMTQEEAAKLVSSQVERIMYMSVLMWRVLAAIVDGAIVTAASGAVVGVLMAAWPAFRAVWEEFVRTQGRMPASDDVTLMVFVVPAAIFWAIWFVYATVMESVRQQTVGKMAFGLKVVDLKGERPAVWRVALRNLIRPVDAQFVGFLGLLVIVWTPRNQRLGDLAGGTRVVGARRGQSEQTQSMNPPPSDGNDRPPMA